jgi:GT2 family glycosyltransferase
MVVRSDVFHRVGGFDSFFKIWGHEDVELSLKLWLFGYRLMVDPRVRVLHLFRQSHPYRVTMDHVHHNLLRMAFSHFSQPRLAKAVNLARSNPNLGRIITEVLFSDIWQQREHYLANRVRDDQWFMDRFNIPF